MSDKKETTPTDDECGAGIDEAVRLGYLEIVATEPELVYRLTEIGLAYGARLLQEKLQ